MSGSERTVTNWKEKKHGWNSPWEGNGGGISIKSSEVGDGPAVGIDKRRQGVEKEVVGS
jgi:hypothetical protein